MTKNSSLSNWDLPRSVSLGLKLKVLFANIMFSMGLVFFLFGSVFLVVFGLQADFISPFYFSDGDPVVKGIVVHVETSNASENKQQIFKNTVKYKIAGTEYYSDSYSLGTIVNELDSVNVQYTAKDPAMSRIVGMRKAPFKMWVLFLILIFPGIGCTMLIIGIRRSINNIKLLTSGILTNGTVVRKEATNTKINKQTVYKVFFNFTTQQGVLTESVVKTHKPHLVEDEEKEQLVYDANNPVNAVLIDTLPQSVRRFLESL